MIAYNYIRTKSKRERNFKNEKKFSGAYEHEAKVCLLKAHLTNDGSFLRQTFGFAVDRVNGRTVPHPTMYAQWDF